MASYPRVAVNFGSAPTGSGGDNNRAGIQKVDADLAQIFAATGFDSTTNQMGINATGAQASAADTFLLVRADFSANESHIAMQDGGSSIFHLGVSETENAIYGHVGSSLAAGSRLFEIDNSGQWGFNRTKVSGITAAFADNIEIIQDGAGDANVLITGYGSVPNIIGQRAAGTESSPTAITSAQTIFDIHARGYDGADFDVDGAFIHVEATENWSATAHGMKLEWGTTDDTTTTVDTRMTLDQDGGLFMAGATGSSQGVGTINATAVYDDGSILTDYVFEYFIDGAAIDKHGPAVRFDQSMFDLDTFIAAWTRDKSLPNMPTREEFEQQRMSLGDLSQRLWEVVELQAIHISQLHERLKTLESA